MLEISANNIPHQTAYPVATLHQIQPFYFLPYKHLGDRGPGRVLIVGAGNGNDVAVALAQGAEHVDAVEIDPVIQSLGSRPSPRPPLPGPAGHRAHQRRPRVHPANSPALRPDPVRAAGLADAARRTGQSAARELPLHRRVDANGQGAPESGWDLRDVQLLRALPGRPLRLHARSRPTAPRRASSWATRWPPASRPCSPPAQAPPAIAKHRGPASTSSCRRTTIRSRTSRHERFRRSTGRRWR